MNNNMTWILYIIGGLILLGILIGTGILAQFFTFIIILAVCGFGGYLIGGDTGCNVGIIVGAVLYLAMCIAKTVNPELKITMFEDGSYIDHKLEDRAEGIAGLVMLAIVLVLLFIFR